jgi:hypothetical protein
VSDEGIHLPRIPPPTVGPGILHVVSSTLPPAVVRLLWDVDPETIDLDRDRTFVFERVMTRGTWEAMQWLRARYSRESIADFLRTQGAKRLPPRDLAYWALVADVELPSTPGGGRPRWAGV